MTTKLVILASGTRVQHYYSNPDKQTDFAGYYAKRKAKKGKRKRGTARVVDEEDRGSSECGEQEGRMVKSTMHKYSMNNIKNSNVFCVLMNDEE